LAVIPFLRTVKLKLDESENSKTGKWALVKKGVLRSAAAFITSTKVTYGIKHVVSAETDFGNLADALKGDGSIGDDNNSVFYHATGFLEKALKELRKDDKECRIVVFVDDLDRCFPDKGLEVLESIKSFFDIEGIIYVIGMNPKTIDFLVQKKFESNSAITGLDYMKKIVQLPFHIPDYNKSPCSIKIIL
jgi:predicted KAP-like P-loop ATPase